MKRVKSIIIMVGGSRMHEDLKRVLFEPESRGGKGYSAVTILDPPPANLQGDELVLAASYDLMGLQPSLTGTNTNVVYGAGEETLWIAAVRAVEALTGEKPFVLFPVRRGQRGRYTCVKGEDRVNLP